MLVKEAGGAILTWAIEGAVNFVRNGFRLDIPEVVEEATEAYRAREDWLTNFINERCVREPTGNLSGAGTTSQRRWRQRDFIRRKAGDIKHGLVFASIWRKHTETVGAQAVEGTW